MLRILATFFAALFGLAFGSFLNVCLSRWPRAESVIHPASHCRTCNRTLAWWENIPLLSWLALRGRCRTCSQPISIRYPLVEAAVGALWAWCVWSATPPGTPISTALLLPAATMALVWLLVALAALDAEHLWLPDFLTWPGILLGLGFHLAGIWVTASLSQSHPQPWLASARYLAGVLAAAAIILFIRWIYWLIRRQEGIGLGDAKLMALLAAWLGLPATLLAFFLGVVMGATVAVLLLLSPRSRATERRWAAGRLPLGTFLCIGGIVSALWGEPLLAAYLRWSGF